MPPESERHDDRQTDRSIPVILRGAEARGAVVRRVQGQARAISDRTLRAHVGELCHLLNAAIDLFPSRGQRSGPDPSGVALSDGQATLPLAIALGIEIDAAGVELARVVLPPAKLRAEALLGNQHPDQPTAQMHAFVAIGEALCADETDRGEP